MTTTASHLDPETLAQLEGLELRARSIVDGYLSGRHRGTHRGQSVEFAEHRKYAVGDDLRRVDWKVFGKTDKVYLKQFEAETNLICHLLIDISESMRYRSDLAALSKLEYAQCLATALAAIVLRQRDSVSLATFDDQMRMTMRESNNPAHLGQLIAVLDEAEPCGKSQLGGVLHEASQRLVHRGVVVVISDLLGDVDTLFNGLKHLRYDRHEVVLLQVLDPAEVDFPFQQPTLYEGLEGLGEVLADPRGVRRAYLAELGAFLERVQTLCQSLGVAHHLVRTDEPFDRALRRVLVSRGAKRG